MRRVALGVALAASTSAGLSCATRDDPGEFSATMRYRVEVQQGVVAFGEVKIYKSSDRVRIEIGEEGPKSIVALSESGLRESVLLVDLESRRMTLLRPQARRAMELPGTRNLSWVRWIVNPCAAQANLTCERVGTEQLNGRFTEKWRVVGQDPLAQQLGRFPMTWWVSPELKSVVRWEDAQGSSLDFTDIRPGEQPDSLFEIPADYQMVDPKSPGP